MTTLKEFGLEVEKPKRRKLIASTHSWDEAMRVAMDHREEYPDITVHIAPELPDGRHIVYIEVEK